MTTWECRTCHRQVTTRYASSEHDLLIHAESRHHANRIIAMGLGLMALGVIAQVISLALRLLGS